jgi:hypothetical protein
MLIATTIEEQDKEVEEILELNTSKYPTSSKMNTQYTCDMQHGYDVSSSSLIFFTFCN